MKMNAAEQRRRKLGVILIARNVHLMAKRTAITEAKRVQVVDDVRFLQKSLSEWNSDDTHFGRAAKMLVEAAIAEVAVAWRGVAK